MPIDTSLPPWLQRNVAQKESFDPSPWLNEAFNQNVQRAKLPLQLQQYQLQNKELELQAEHQGLQNDILNQELDLQKEELPAFQAAIKSAASTPGGAVALNVPGFRSKKYNDLWLSRLKADAETAVGQTLIKDQVGLAVLAQKVAEQGVDPTPANINGKWDRSALTDLQLKAVEDENMRAANLRRLADPTLRMAQDAADLKAQLRASEAKTVGAGVLQPTPPEMTKELERQQYLKDQISVMDAHLAHGTTHGADQLEAAGRYTRELENANAELDAAKATNNADAIATAQRKVDTLTDYLARTHPDKGKLLLEQALKSRHDAAYKAYLESPTKKAIKAEYDKARQELEDYVAKEATKPSITPSSSAGAATLPPVKTIGGFKVRVIKP